MIEKKCRCLAAAVRLFWIFGIVGAGFAFSSNAQADTYLYTFTNAATSFTFQLDSQPTVDSFVPGLGFEVPIITIPAYPDILFVQFFPTFNSGGIGFADNLDFAVDSGGTTLLYDGLQLYSGDEATPTLLLGTGNYLLTNTNDPELTATLSVLQVAAVPETSTWAMMIFGFCGVGFMAYRRKQSLNAVVTA